MGQRLSNTTRKPNGCSQRHFVRHDIVEIVYDDVTDCTFESSKLAEGSVNNLTTLSYKTAPIPIGGSIHTSPKFIHRQTNTTKDSSTDENSYSLIPSEKLIELPGFIPGSSTNDICRSTQYPIFVKHSSKLHPSHTSAQAEETTRKLPSTQNYEIHRPETCIGQQVFPDEALTKASAGDESARKSDSSLYSMETYAFQNTTDVNISGSQSQKNVVQNNVKTSETVRFTQHRNRKFWKQMIMAPNHLPADHSVVDMINIQEYNVEPSKLNTESSMQQKLSVPYGKQKRKHCDVKTSWLRPYVGQSTQSSLQNVTVSELRSFCEAKKQIVSLRNSMQMNDGRKRFASPSTGDVSQTAVELVSKDWRSDPRFNRGFHSGLMPAQSNSKCAMSVTASTPIGHLGNVARLTLFTLKSESDDTVNNTWPFPATLENRIPASSPEAQLLPECLQLAMHPHYGRTQKRYTSHSNANMYLGGNVTPKPRLSRNHIRCPDFVQYSSCSSLPEPISDAKEIQIYNYQFWIRYEPWVDNVFSNPLDRRIESIGRLSDCRIRLTGRSRCSPKGFRERLVNIIAPDAVALQKCCRLFDDKFPNFYATSGLLRISDKLVEPWISRRPRTSSGVSKNTRRRRTVHNVSRECHCHLTTNQSCSAIRNPSENGEERDATLKAIANPEVDDDWFSNFH